MDMALYAIDHGFAEAKLRGFRSTFLKEDHYSQMKNLSSIEEVLQYLASETDYGDYIDINNPSINSLKNSMRKKLSDEVDHIEINCSQELSRFIFFIPAIFFILLHIIHTFFSKAAENMRLTMPGRNNIFNFSVLNVQSFYERMTSSKNASLAQNLRSKQFKKIQYK